ncbi:uncharacterized protein LOC111031897 [Myzus persicae]|uniref:uncharacterized protein LOC111031897 n=1 Tax=Myzus persicae TaxID=13164 RepID=UPI000B933A84|nr:uncharacterized protein LOC111031897 [Myzus persicae]
MKSVFEELRSAKFHIPSTFPTGVRTGPATIRYSSTPNVATTCRRHSVGDAEFYQSSSVPFEQSSKLLQRPKDIGRNLLPSFPPENDMPVANCAGQTSRQYMSLVDDAISSPVVDTPDRVDTTSCTSEPELRVTPAGILKTSEFGGCRWSSAPNILPRCSLMDRTDQNPKRMTNVVTSLVRSCWPAASPYIPNGVAQFGDGRRNSSGACCAAPFEVRLKVKRAKKNKCYSCIIY